MDHRDSDVERRRSWHGLKRHVKRFFGWRVPNAALRQVVRVVPSFGNIGRLPAPSRLKEVEGRVNGVGFVMLRPDLCVVAKELYWGKGHRPRGEDDFALELFAQAAARADVMLDIGAYTGIFTLVGTLANPELEAHAFEIVPDVYRLLFDNCVRNDVLVRSTLHHEGVGTPGEVMRVPVDSVDSALPDFYSTRLHFDTGVLVRIVSLDSLSDSVPAGARVVVKVDVEGTENAIFRDGQGFLSSFRPDILCEVLHGVAEPGELTDLLEPHGYHFYLVREGNLAAADRIEPDIRYRDWFFTNRSADELRADGITVAGG